MKTSRKSSGLVLLFLLALAGFAGGVSAATIYVDQAYGPGGDGSQEMPFDTIQAAINSGAGETIIVYPGTYNENINVTANLKIIGYDGPYTTRIVGSLPPGDHDVVTLAESIIVTIQGFNISGGRYGIYEPQDTTLYLKNCVVCANLSHGLNIVNTNAKPPHATVVNNVFANNTGSGIAFVAYDGIASDTYPPFLTALNNIFFANSAYGIQDSILNAISSYKERIVLDYNDTSGNSLGGYSPNFGTGKTYPTGIHSITLPPEFVGGTGPSAGKDFRLRPTSPCRDTGNPAIAYLDPDGTVNDMGAYGGPGAQRFYTNPNDGPIVREVTIDKGLIPKGETFTIRAKGAVR